MTSMSFAAAITSFRRCGRRCLLVSLACGVTSGAAFAQAEAPAQNGTPAPNAATPNPAAADSPAPDTVEDSADTETTAPDAAAPDAPPQDAVVELNVADAPATESAADTIAANEQFLETTIEQVGRKSLQTAEAYIGLADAQRQAGEFEDAAESYLTAVEVYREVDGPFTPLAIAPLTSLGDNYHESQDNLQAVSAYSEARTVSRRVYGLHNEEQIVLLDRLSRSLLEMNQLVEAEEQQVEALRLIQRSHPGDSDPVLAAIYKYAEWLGARFMYQSERDQYLRAQRIIRDSYGEENIREVTPLLGIGNTYRRERNPIGMGRAALENAVEIVSKQSERDALLTATALRDLGDWSVAFNEPGFDGTEYRRAWDLLGTLPDGDKLRAEWFFAANYVLYEPISPRGLSTEPEAKSGHVTAKFDLDIRGNAYDVTVVESDPPGFKDEAVLRHIRRSRFRPLIADGAFVAGDDLAIQFRFRYAEDALVTQNEGAR
jgi:tetratricopeptide (TPR) repeat protein